MVSISLPSTTSTFFPGKTSNARGWPEGLKSMIEIPRCSICFATPSSCFCKFSFPPDRFAA
jgi:hypothetical protein